MFNSSHHLYIQNQEALVNDEGGVQKSVSVYRVSGVVQAGTAQHIGTLGQTTQPSTAVSIQSVAQLWYPAFL